MEGRAVIFIGIDPGLDGAVALVDSENASPFRIVTAVTPTIMKTKGRGKRLYDLARMRRLLADIGKAHNPQEVNISVEKQQAMKDQGLSSTFSTGRGFGLWEGLVCGMGFSYQLVHPRTWQNQLTKGQEGGPKERALSWVQSAFPSVDLKANNRCRVPHKGIVDALCLAEYGRRTWGG